MERKVRIQTEKFERYSYSTLVRPTDLSLISTLSKRRSGITRAGVLSHPHSLKSHQISTTFSTMSSLARYFGLGDQTHR
ncbi:unnamed protein product [Brassica oleracea var. botrytis]